MMFSQYDLNGSTTSSASTTAAQHVQMWPGRAPVSSSQFHGYPNGGFPSNSSQLTHHHHHHPIVQQRQHLMAAASQQQHHQQQPFVAMTSSSSLGSLSQSEGLMLPPSLPFSSNNHQSHRLHNQGRHSNNLERAERKQQAALQRRQELHERHQREKPLNEQGIGLFDSPEKVQGENSTISSVLGEFSNAQRLINSHNSCIGIDYQPPTPAPMQHVIGGDDDEMGSSGNSNLSVGMGISNIGHDNSRPHRRPPPTIPRPPNHTRLPDNLDQTHRPNNKAHNQHHRTNSSMMTSLQQTNGVFQKPQGFLSEKLHSHNEKSQSTLSNNRLKQAAEGLSKLNTTHNEDENLQQILREMKNPLANSQETNLPEPLSAIYTPKVTEHEGNKSNFGAPKYFSSFGPNPMPAPPLAMASIKDEPKTNRKPGIKHSDILEHKLSNTSSTNSDTLAKAINEAKISSKSAIASNLATPMLPNFRGARLSESDSEDEGNKCQVPAQSGENSGSKKTPATTLGMSNSQENICQTISSSDSSGSDSESESEEESNKSESEEEEEKANQDKDDKFSLGKLMEKVKSTGSPGPNIHPSPRIQQPSSVPPPQMSSNVEEEDEEARISQMLSDTPKPDLPDLVLDNRRRQQSVLKAPNNSSSSRRDFVARLEDPISPLGSNSPISVSPVRNVNKRSLRRFSSNNRSSYHESSDEENLYDISPAVNKRSSRKNAKLPSTKKASSDPKRNLPKPRQTATAKTTSKTASPSRKTPQITSSSSNGKSGSKRGKKKPSPQNYRLSSSSSDEAGSEREMENKSQKEESSTNVLKEGKKEIKSRCISKIFAIKNKNKNNVSTTSGSSGGKGGGKSGVTVERVTNATAYHPVRRRKNTNRPIILCKISMNILPSSLDLVNKYLVKEVNQNSRKRKTSEKLLKPEERRAKMTKPNDYYVNSSGDTNNESKPEHKPKIYDLPNKKENTKTWNSIDVGSSNLMPPPTKMFYSYIEQRSRGEEDEENEEDVSAYMTDAKQLKHEADKETDRERQAMKYLEAVLIFILCGNLQEKRGDKHAAFTMYKETQSLIRHVCRPFRNSEYGNFDNKLAVLSFRCQSLMYLKMYKMKRHELKECQKIIGDHIQKATASQENSPLNNGNNISPTPSPAGSEGSVCSRSSGYGSAGETKSNSTVVCLSVPQSVMQKQHQVCNYLSQSHELWEMADVYAQRGQCEGFIIRLDQTCGPLTLHSTLKELVKYTKTGLDYLAQKFF